MAPVGIRIARLRKQDGALTDDMAPKPAAQPAPPAQPAAQLPESPKQNNSSSYQKPVPSYQVFLEGSLLYLGCVLFPGILAFCLRKLEENEMIYIEQMERWKAYAHQLAVEFICPLHKYATLYDMDELFWYCPSYESLPVAKSMFWSPDAAWSDLTVVGGLSVTLALIRVSVVRLLVNLHEPGRVEALVRMKSIHLLSQDYVLTPRATPMNLPSEEDQQDHAAALDAEALQRLQIPHIERSSSNASSIGLRLDDSDGAFEIVCSDSTVSVLPETLSHEDRHSSPENKEDLSLSEDDQEVIRAVAGAIAANQHLESPSGEPEQSADSHGPATRLYAAPRMATAVFRLLYSVTAAVLALALFRSADFWPPYVLGHGSTRKCWDLSGGLTVGMDGDFDSRNTSLRGYFLWQASYHWHSGAFHILSTILLFLPENRTVLKRSGVWNISTSYVHSLLRHALALMLIGTTYVFSSLRRLCAIGMFAFDLSSIFLHALQICINAEDESVFRKASVVRGLQRYLVMPFFLYCRFFIWPAIWWSAFTESRGWFEQLEMTLFPGTSFLLQVVLNVCMLGVMIVNVVYLRRLLQHPHLQKVLSGELNG